ncbi:MAG: hypothetical protein HRT94_09875 [Alphaproteobacteria bacterium]|nr:hypothetical protein [Alphaproteobacteria bacterium]
MHSGDVDLRKIFEEIVPYDHKDSSRRLWFFELSRKIEDVSADRLKSLFYDNRCRVWGNEAVSIYEAHIRAKQSQIQNMLEANARRESVHAEVRQLKEEVKSELLEDIRTLLLEFKSDDHGAAILNNRTHRITG